MYIKKNENNSPPIRDTCEALAGSLMEAHAFVWELLQSFVADTSDSLRIIKEIYINIEKEFLFTMDVVPLYTFVP